MVTINNNFLTPCLLKIRGSCILIFMANRPELDQQAVLSLGDFSPSIEQLRVRWQTDPLNAFKEWRRTKNAANKQVYSERSIEQHSAMWANFLAYLTTRKVDIQTVQPDAIEAFLKQLRGRPIKDNDRSRLPLAPGDTPLASHSTLNRYTKLLAETFIYLADLNVRRGNPVAPVAKIFTKPEAPPAVEFLNREQETALLDYIAGLPIDDWKDERDRTILYLLLASGPTVGELARLRIDDVQTGDYAPVINLPNHDLTHGHAAPISSFALAPLVTWRSRRIRALERYKLLPGLPTYSSIEEALPGSILFPATTTKGEELESSAIYNIVRLALDAISFPGKSRGPQTLRNTFARRQLFNNADPLEVQRWLGLASDKTVKKILRTLPGTKTSIVF